MPDYTEREQEGRIVVERYGCPPLHFEGRQQYVAWEREYLMCIIVNGAPGVCFKLHPPQVPVHRNSTHRMRIR